MSEEKTAAAIESAMEAAFGTSAPEPPAPAPIAQAPAAPEEAPTAEEPPDPAQALLDAAEPPPEVPVAPSAAEPEFTIEVNGQTEVVKGAEQIRELLQKGRHYSRGTEEIARVRDQLVAQGALLNQQQAFQREIVGDIAELRALDKQIEQFNGVDWSRAIDTDFVQALKLQEQRNAVKEMRAAKLAEIQGKQQRFEQGQAEAARSMLAAEEAALLAKLPDWRNNERATAEKQAITRELTRYGFQPSEISHLMDHRMVLLARDAMKWQELQRSKTEKVKQVRDAPPVVKPGAAPAQADANSKAGFQQFTREFRKQGRSGNHRAQETALEKVLSRTFK